MRILVILPENPPKRILIDLTEQKLIRNIKDLIDRKKHLQAIGLAIQKGRLKKEVGIDEFENLGTDLILRDNSAHWDTKREE